MSAPEAAAPALTRHEGAKGAKGRARLLRLLRPRTGRAPSRSPQVARERDRLRVARAERSVPREGLGSRGGPGTPGVRRTGVRLCPGHPGESPGSPGSMLGAGLTTTAVNI